VRKYEEQDRTSDKRWAHEMLQEKDAHKMKDKLIHHLLLSRSVYLSELIAVAREMKASSLSSNFID